MSSDPFTAHYGSGYPPTASYTGSAPTPFHSNQPPPPRPYGIPTSGQPEMHHPTHTQGGVSTQGSSGRQQPAYPAYPTHSLAQPPSQSAPTYSPQPMQGPPMPPQPMQGPPMPPQPMQGPPMPSQPMQGPPMPSQPMQGASLYPAIPAPQAYRQPEAPAYEISDPAGQPGGAPPGPANAFMTGMAPPPGGMFPSARTGPPAVGPSAHQFYGASPDPQLETSVQETLMLNPYPHFAVSTSQRIPNSTSFFQKTQLPIAAVFRPLAPTPEGLSEVPSVNFGALGKVVRCTRCRTYINPFVEWEANGQRWLCNICSYSNETPAGYQCSLDERGKRLDTHERSELCRSSVEFIAPEDYMLRPPQAPTFFFLIDVSLAAVKSGMVDAVCLGIKTAVQSGSLPGGPRALIGFATFDNVVHFYSMDPTPQMAVMTDLKDAFVPLPDGILVSAVEAQQSIESFLDTLPTMWRNQKIAESCLGSAMKAAFVAMRHIGGKLSVFASSLPQTGEYTLNPSRDSSKNATATPAQREAEHLKASSDAFREIAGSLTQAQISVDIYACPTGNLQLDLATLSAVAVNTGGDLHLYPWFTPQVFGEKLRQEICHSLLREQGWESLVRFRVSKGWSIQNWYGHFHLRMPDLLVLPCCHADQTFTVVMTMQDNVVPGPYAFMQSALLYTNSNGERRIRVHTYCFAVSTSLSEVISGINVQATIYTIAQRAIDTAAKKGLPEARAYVQTTCSQLRHCLASDKSPINAALTSEADRMITLQLLGLLKTVSLRDAKDVTYDTRVFHWERLRGLPMEQALANLCPRMFPVHDLSPECGTHDAAGQLILPTPIPLSSSYMVEGGAYLLENGEIMLMWISRGVTPHWLRSVFGVDSLEQLQPDYSEALIGSTGESAGRRIAAIIQHLQIERLPTFMKLTVVRQGDPNEYKFFDAVIEDQNHALLISYAEFAQRTSGTRTVMQSSTLPPTMAVAAGRQY